MRQSEMIALVFSFVVFVMMASWNNRVQTTVTLGDKFRFGRRRELTLLLSKGCWLLIVVLFCFVINGCVSCTKKKGQSGTVYIYGNPIDQDCSYDYFINFDQNITIHVKNSSGYDSGDLHFNSDPSQKYPVDVPLNGSGQFTITVNATENDSQSCLKCSNDGVPPSWAGIGTFTPSTGGQYPVQISCQCP